MHSGIKRFSRKKFSYVPQYLIPTQIKEDYKSIHVIVKFETIKTIF
uniref:Uncharacterized protein n=1 Tax=Anguilla anguilla TaxID=7936 RepID=A0A0E9URL6_ANGAN